ncbi:Hsp70 family protein [Streptomyces marincola]|uniref:Hsp70 family protein n=1 Tax=Streptomyces marincola TaxID=2878388 RepID=UPI001CF2195A|nr:Hsp70 family protein [Streptomyces marincola]UCM88813.1 Hsp70 family protein [Streptomyces marincola]
MAIPSRSTSFTPKVVVAIDFGTHGSGFALARVAALNDRATQRVITYQTFTVTQDTTYPKDLTAVLVDADRTPVAFGNKARDQWLRLLARGNPDHHGYAGRFKMGIQPRGLESGVPRFEGSLAGADREVVKKLTTATLRHISGAALDTLRRINVQGIAHTADDVRWCVTVPAIWGEAERALMRAAAEAAGLPGDQERLLLVQEPEAAAIYCALYTGALLAPGRPEGRLDVDAAPGSRFMVVDCGGGTVDITSYRLRPEGVGSGRLEESRVADGGRLGSAYVNHGFMTDLLAERFGADRLATLQADFPLELGQLESVWEREKVSLASETAPDGRPVIDDPVFVDVPGRVWEVLDTPTRERLTALAEGATHLIVVTPGEVKKLFDAVVDPIIDVIERQRALDRRDDPAEVGEVAEQMVVVGGFARSPYLRDALAHRFGDTARVVLPEDPAVAVLAGAVHFAYDPSVIWGRRSKYTYGFGCARPFEEGVDPQEKRFINDFGEPRCNDRFAVMVRRAESVPVDRTVTGTLRISPSTRVATLPIVATYAPDPRYDDEEGVEQLAALAIDVSSSHGSTKDWRYADIDFSFGTTELTVEAKDRQTGAVFRTEVRFDELYGRRNKGRRGPEGRRS